MFRVPFAFTFTALASLSCSSSEGVVPALIDDSGTVSEQSDSPDASGVDAKSADTAAEANPHDVGGDVVNDSGLEAEDTAGDDADAQADAGPTGCNAGDLKAGAEGVDFQASCSGSWMKLMPYVTIGGTRRGGGKDGPCTAAGSTIQCPAGGDGQVQVSLSGPSLSLSFTAAADVVVEAMSLEGDAEVPFAQGWLSNGYQSWSMSGVVSLIDAPSDAVVQEALQAQGESEVYRRGTELSWWYTFVGGSKVSLVAGATSADRFRSWIQVNRSPAPGAVRIRLVSGGVERVPVQAGATLQSEAWRVQLGEDLRWMLEGYGAALESRHAIKPRPATSGWNSWYCFWDEVGQEDIYEAGGTTSVDRIAQVLSPNLPPASAPSFVVIDDGWEAAWGDWSANSKFPQGLAAAAQAIKAKGFRPGIWLAPLLVAPGSQTAKAHPSWLVQGASYDHPSLGKMNILDVTDADAAQHLQDVIKALTGAGYELLKIDFLFAGAQEGIRDEQVTGMEAYHRAMQTIRAAAGEETILVAVGAPPVASFPYVDGWRVGNDIAFKPIPIINLPQPTWTFIANQARQIASRYPFCQATLCDADPVILRSPLTQDEVGAGGWVAASTGGALFLSDDLVSLPADRWSWGLDPVRGAIAVGGVPAAPESFFPDVIPSELKSMKDNFNLFNAEHQVPSKWRMPGGRRLGFNWTGKAVEMEGVQVPSHSARELPVK
ncbi:MAG: alpha-galactosidase [Deltaproteobacteria bacterium]|nr:alpha-galactosidase [Deltaproteobacteria bacterium]